MTFTYNPQHGMSDLQVYFACANIDYFLHIEIKFSFIPQRKV